MEFTNCRMNLIEGGEFGIGKEKISLLVKIFDDLPITVNPVTKNWYHEEIRLDCLEEHGDVKVLPKKENEGLMGIEYLGLNKIGGEKYMTAYSHMHGKKAGIRITDKKENLAVTFFGI